MLPQSTECIHLKVPPLCWCLYSEGVQLFLRVHIISSGKFVHSVNEGEL